MADWKSNRGHDLCPIVTISFPENGTKFRHSLDTLVAEKEAGDLIYGVLDQIQIIPANPLLKKMCFYIQHLV